MSRPTPSVVTYRDVADGVVIRGAKIRAYGRVAYVPARYLRQVADRLHDIADDLEQEGGS